MDVSRGDNDVISGDVDVDVNVGDVLIFTVGLGTRICSLL